MQRRAGAVCVNDRLESIRKELSTYFFQVEDLGGPVAPEALVTLLESSAVASSQVAARIHALLGHNTLFRQTVPSHVSVEQWGRLLERILVQVTRDLGAVALMPDVQDVLEYLQDLADLEFGHEWKVKIFSRLIDFVNEHEELERSMNQE